MLCIWAFCHLNPLETWHFLPIYLELWWILWHYSLYDPSVYRFYIDPDNGFGGGVPFSHTVLESTSRCWSRCWGTLFFGFLLDFIARARQLPVVHLECAWGFRIFLRMSMHVVKGDWTGATPLCAVTCIIEFLLVVPLNNKYQKKMVGPAVGLLCQKHINVKEPCGMGEQPLAHFSLVCRYIMYRYMISVLMSFFLYRVF